MQLLRMSGFRKEMCSVVPTSIYAGIYLLEQGNVELHISASVLLIV